MDLKLYVAFLKRWGWLIALIAAVTGMTALIFEGQQTPLYAATTTMLVNQERASRSGPDFEALQTRERLARTYAELLVKRPVLEAAISALQVNLDAGVLSQRINVTPVPNTELLKLTVRDPDPQRAADIANAIAQVFPKIEGELLADPYAVSRQTLFVVEEARPNPVPVSPNIPRSLLLAAAIGAMLAAAGGFLYDHFNDRVKGRADIERLTGLATLAEIGRIPGSEPADRLVVPGKTPLPIAEAYRMVRGHIAAHDATQPLRTIVVTSSVPLEGKSTTVANLGVALAQTGKRVILVDADVRRPTLHKFFRRTNTHGLTTALLRHGGDAAADHLASTDIENLQIMPAGPVLANSVGYLGSKRMAELIEELKTLADLVIFDTPSLLTVVDAQLIINITDATLLVVRGNATREAAVQRAAEQIIQSGANLLGVVLNDVAQLKNYADYYTGASVEESIELIDFTRAANERQQTDGRGPRVSERSADKS